MDVPFGELLPGERFRLAGAPVNQSWVKIETNHRGNNARALHCGDFAVFAPDVMVSLLRRPGKKGRKTDLGTA